jgi:hypothetical protein
MSGRLQHSAKVADKIILSRIASYVGALLQTLLHRWWAGGGLSVQGAIPQDFATCHAAHAWESVSDAR